MTSKVVISFQSMMCAIGFGLYMNSFVFGFAVYFGIIAIAGAINSLKDE
jgi:hypothetical protein